MAYLSKNTIVKALGCIQSMDVMVPVQSLCAIQYFIALDRYYHHKIEQAKGQKEDHSDSICLDANSTKEKKLFISFTSDVIVLDDGNYFKTFKELYVGSKKIQNTISSNFFNGSSVDISKNSPNKIPYPQQGDKPLLYALDKKVYREIDYYANIKYYITTEEARFAFALWLLRKNSEINSLDAESLREKLKVDYTEELVDLLIPPLNFDFDSLKEYFELELSEQMAYISKADLLLEQGSSDANIEKLPLQQIFYGAPGTGKSFKVDEVCKKHIHYRITFHPDTDYASFVGCYKPKSHKKNMLAGNKLNETQLLSCFFDSVDKSKYHNATKARYLYESLIHTKDIRDLGLDANTVAEKLNAKKFSGCAYTTEATCMYNIYDWLVADGFVVENKISYEFVPQSFTIAYIDAWKHQADGTPVFLVIEEINRGNCAQIFGDLFQLLDRDKDGFSQYEISPDTELQEYINEAGLSVKDIRDSDGNDISSLIASGELMKLPDNLYIWATMNTSDQSLFPIDSAFKRRWDWKYLKIKDHPDQHYRIKLNDEVEYDWYAFIERINQIIASMTSSADKQLGYFFCKADGDGIIKADTFVAKVIFYLWNDVFKDYGFEDTSLFTFTEIVDGKEETRELTFPDFYDKEGEKVDETRLKGFIDSVMNWKKKKEESN